MCGDFGDPNTMKYPCFVLIVSLFVVGCGTSESAKKTDTSQTTPLTKEAATPLTRPAQPATQAQLDTLKKAFQVGAKWTYDYTQVCPNNAKSTRTIEHAVNRVEAGQSGFTRVYFSGTQPFFLKDGSVYTSEMLPSGYQVLTPRYKRFDGKSTTYKSVISRQDNIEVRAKRLTGPVSVPAGTYSGCVAYIFPEPNKMARKVTWCDGVGMVRQQKRTTVPENKDKVCEEEYVLKRYLPAGVKK